MRHPTHPPVARRTRALQHGLTMVESLIVLAVTAVTLGSALPAFQQARQLRHLEGAAFQMATDLRLARSLAVAHGAPVRLSVQQPAGGSCYVVHTGSAGACTCSATGQATCSGAAQPLRSVGFESTGPVRLATAPTSMLFDADRGTVTPTGTMRFQLQGGPAIHQVVNIMGRVRACSPAAALRGYPAC